MRNSEHLGGIMAESISASGVECAFDLSEWLTTEGIPDDVCHILKGLGFCDFLRDEGVLTKIIHICQRMTWIVRLSLIAPKMI
jgi:hypothetical protein